ncbi:MAG TPA: efflux RND transporter periplasmic adaptor subunit, partial [Anaeromyxobacteraceae bacterium]|nr:efflux RND transporter periplasmic adaptor subunit [Anaeromyxobacteraceae bacterium]
VPAYRVERRDLVQRVVASGRVLPPARVSLGSLSLAQVARVMVDEGDRVKAGQLLLQLEDAEARAGLAQGRAAVAQAQARLSQVRLVSSRVSAEALRQAELRVEQARTRLERTETLAAAGSLPQADLDDARKALELARSARDSAAVEAMANAEVGSEYRLALAALAQARGQEQAAEVKLGQTRVTAPGDGVVLERHAEPGDVVAAGKALLVLALDGATRLSVQPDERTLAWLRAGQPAQAVADAFPGRPFPAEVSWVSPAVDASRGTVEIRLAVVRPPDFLRSDMTVSVNMEVARRPGALVVPADAVQDLGGEPSVLCLRGGRVERRPVRLGARADGVVEVSDGVAEGEAVVAPAAGAIEPGARARARLVPAPGGGRGL